MKFNKKRILSFALAGVLGLNLLTACQTNEDDDDTEDTSEKTEMSDSENEEDDDTQEEDDDLLAAVIPEETVTLDVYTQLANYSGEQIGWFGQILKDKFNVKLNIINEADGTFTTRMESQDLGDIVVFGDDTDTYKQAINAGLLFDWEDEDLVQTFGPHIWEEMQPALEKNKKISGGNLYGFGHNVGSSSDEYEPFFYRPDIRWDLYKELGYPEVETLEDFIPVLEDMVELEPESDTGGKTYGVSLFSDWDGDMVMFVKATAALYGYDEFGIGLYDVENQEYEGALEEDGMYLRCLKFYNDLYQRGLLDPDSMTQTFTDMSEDYQNGAAFFNIFDYMGSGLYNTPEHLEEDKAMMPLAADDQKNLAYGLNIYGNNRVWTIGANSNYPELCMAIIDWFCTPEGTMTMAWGPQGTVWDYDEDGRPFLTEFGLEVRSDETTEMIDGYTGTYIDGSSQINNTTWSYASENPDASNGDPYEYSLWETYKERPVSDIEEDWREFTDSLDVNEYLEDNDHLAISVGTTYSGSSTDAELTTIWNQVTEAVKTYSWQAIYAESDEEFEEIVDEMRDQCYEYGYEKCIEFQQEEAEERARLENEAMAR